MNEAHIGIRLFRRVGGLDLFGKFPLPLRPLLQVFHHVGILDQGRSDLAPLLTYRFAQLPLFNQLGRHQLGDGVLQGSGIGRHSNVGEGGRGQHRAAAVCGYAA